MHALSLSLSLYPFFLICCSLSIPISLPISEHRSTLPLSLIHTISVTSTDPQLRSGKTRSSINPQAPISLALIHKHRLDPTRSDLTEISLAPIKQDPYPRAPIVPVKHWSSTDLSLCYLSVWVCLYVGVFVYLCVFFFFFEQVYICIDLSMWMCVCVWVCLCASEEKEEDEERRSYA